ncbi:MAG: hypothetical protein L3J97_06695, partial [Thermoplasmata archaeon]|nr:hypothetical protein [Thermoplasmata archaeon]
MRSWVVIASTDRAESVRRTLRTLELLRKDLRATRSGNEVAFPVQAPPRPPVEATRVEEREVAPQSRPPRSYRELLHLPPDQQALLPRAFDVLGDLVIVRIPPELGPHSGDIGAALLAFVPGARRVGW